MGASDKTKLITKILQGEFEKAENNQANAGSHNAILSSNIFSTLEDKATIDKMVELKATVDGERIFSKTLIFTIQKNTYEKVKDFLTEEARNG